MCIKANHILLGINVLSIVLILIITFLPDNVLRVILGLPLVLFFPGFTLISALYPRKDSLSGIERLALSFGLSIAVVPLIGLVLNYTPWGIRLYPILLSLAIFIGAMSVIAWYRGRRYPSEEKVVSQLAFKFPPGAELWNNQTRWGKTLTILLAVMIIGAVGTLVYVVKQPRSVEQFTEFYVLNEEGKAENYPSVISFGRSASVVLGIINHENELTNYRIEIVIDGENVGQVGPVNLETGATWEQAVTVTPKRRGENQKLEFLLYKNADADVYESLHLWIKVE